MESMQSRMAVRPAKFLFNLGMTQGDTHMGGCQNYGLYRDNGKESGNYSNGLYKGYIKFKIAGRLSKLWSPFWRPYYNTAPHI